MRARERGTTESLPPRPLHRGDGLPEFAPRRSDRPVYQAFRRDIAGTSPQCLTDIILMSYTRHMDIGRHVQAIQSDLAAAAALGDESTAAAGERLAAAVESSLQLRLF